MLTNFILSIIGILIFISGYTLGKVNSLYKNSSPNIKHKFWNKKNDLPETVTIDESKFVTEMDTSSFTKGNKKSIGEETVTNSSVSGAVTRLKSLKGNTK